MVFLLGYVVLFFPIARCQYGLWNQKNSLGFFTIVSAVLNLIICLIFGCLMKADIIQEWCKTIDAEWIETFALIFLLADVFYFNYSFDHISHFPALSTKSAHRKTSSNG